MFSKIPSITNRKISSGFHSLEELVNYIKSKDRPEYESILEAREHKDNKEVYDEIKKTQIPCTTINYRYNGYVNGDNISTPTGYMFFDVDDVGGLDIDFTHVAAYWKSLSGDGYSVIVKVLGLSTNSKLLSKSYEYVSDIIGIDYDPRAVSIDRVTVLSYDVDAKYDPDVIPLNIELEEEEKGNLAYIKRITNSYDRSSPSIRFDNLDDLADLHQITFGKEGYHVFIPTVKFVKAFLPSGFIREGLRNTCLSSYIQNFIWLNPDRPEAYYMVIAKSNNDRKCKPPLSNNEVESIVKAKYKNRKNAVPIIGNHRRILYDKSRNFTNKEKQAISGKVSGVLKAEKTKEKISEVLLNWDESIDGKQTQKNIAKCSNRCAKTVRKYLPKIKADLGVD